MYEGTRVHTQQFLKDEDHITHDRREIASTTDRYENPYWYDGNLTQELYSWELGNAMTSTIKDLLSQHPASFGSKYGKQHIKYGTCSYARD